MRFLSCFLGGEGETGGISSSLLEELMIDVNAIDDDVVVQKETNRGQCNFVVVFVAVVCCPVMSSSSPGKRHFGLLGLFRGMAQQKFFFMNGHTGQRSNQSVENESFTPCR